MASFKELARLALCSTMTLASLTLGPSALATSFYASSTDPNRCACGDPNPDCGTPTRPYECIQDGANRAVAGDEVVAADGEYLECVSVFGKTGINIRSAIPRGATIRWHHANPICQIDIPSGNQFTVGFNSSSNVVFQGFRVTGSSNRGIWVVSSGGGNEIRNVEVFGNHVGIQLYEGGDSITQGSWIHDNTGTGVSIVGAATDISLRDVTVESNLGFGIDIAGARTELLNVTSRSNAGGFGIIVWSDDNTLTNVTVTGNAGTGISIRGSRNLVAGGQISHSNYGLQVFRPTGAAMPSQNQIRDLDIHDNNPNDGIALNDGIDTTISRVHIHHGVGGIVETKLVSRSIIEDSEIDHLWGNRSHGLYLQGHESILRRNRIHHVESFGVHLWSAPWGSSTRHYIVEGNDIYANGAGMVLGGADVATPVPRPDCELSTEGDPSWDFCRSFPRYVEIRYNAIHHNRSQGFFYDGRPCEGPDRNNSFHHNTLYRNFEQQIYLRGGVKRPPEAIADPVTFKNNIVVGRDASEFNVLLQVDNSTLDPNNFDGNLYFAAGASVDANTPLFVWNGTTYSLSAMQSTGVSQSDTCATGQPTNVIMDARSAWSTNLRFVDPTMSKWTAAPAAAGSGDFHLRRGSDGASGGVCCPESNGGTDLDGETVLFCLPQSCNTRSSAVAVGADYPLDADGNGVSDRYDCTPANGSICDDDVYTEGQEAACVSQGYPGAPYDSNVYPGGAELCDGKDNDCDGSASFSGGEADADSDGYYESCGMDCNPMPFTGVPIHFGGAEICNNIDDDCDAEVDEDAQVFASPWVCGVGACQDHARCVDGTAQPPLIECVPKPPGQETCNGIDDDCDGTIDNGVMQTTCGIGACARSVVSCRNGVPQTEPCVPGTPGFEASDQIATCFDGVDNDCDGISDLDCAINPSDQQVATGGGGASLTISGSHQELCAASAQPGCAPVADDVYESITETGAPSTKKAMIKVWIYSSVPVGETYELRMEGFRATTESETVTFTYKKLTSGTTCDASGTYLAFSPPLTITKPADDDAWQTGSIGVVTASAPVCIKMTDAVRDNPVTTVRLDRLFLFPVQTLPACTDADSDGYTPACDTGCSNPNCPLTDCNDGNAQQNPGLTENCSDPADNNCNGVPDASEPACQPPVVAATEILPPAFGTLTGSYTDTLVANETPERRESLEEVLSANTSKLQHTWVFDNVPAGTHRLRFEGRQDIDQNEGDDFQFYWALTSSGEFPNSIGGALISSSTDLLVTSSGTFVTATPGTVYIQLRDTNRANNKKKLDSVSIDYLAIVSE